jgi:hypothetical protein
MAAQAVSPGPLTTETWVRSHSSVREVFVGQAFLGVRQFLSIIFIPSVLHTHLHLHVALPKGQTGTFQIAICLC